MKLNVPFFSSSSAKNKMSKSGRRSSNKDRGGGGGKSGSFSSTASSSSSSSSDESATTPRTVLPPGAERNPPPPPPRAVTRADLEVALRRVVASEEELAAMLAEAESAGLDDVLEGLAAAEAQPADEAELRDAFAVFDADGDGRISADELRAVLGSLGEHHACSADDCRRMIRAVDGDGDGFVCFDEFSRMMMHGL